jgi:RHS repeat-associated protein
VIARYSLINKNHPFGMVMDGRNYMAGNVYKYGFNGQEKENDISGVDGGYLVFEYRIQDARLGRFLSSDPLENEYPWNSPYAFAENRCIDGID